MIFVNLINMCLGVFHLGFILFGTLCFLDLGDYFLPHFREVFNYFLLKYFLSVFLFVFFFWDSYDSNVVAFNIVLEVSEEEDKKKDHEKILEEIIVENFPKMGKEIATQIQETQKGYPKQDKPKAKHPKTHINQFNEDQTQRADIKSIKGKATNNTQGGSHKDNS